MKTVTLEVTQRDIDRAIAWRKLYAAGQGGIGHYNCNCVVANAAKRKFHNEINVMGTQLSVKKKVKPVEKITYYYLDSVGNKLVTAFDTMNYADVKPCTVTLTKSAS